MGNRGKLRPVQPGEVLLEEFLKPMGLSQSRVALEIDEVGAPIEREVRTLASVGQD